MLAKACLDTRLANMWRVDKVSHSFWSVARYDLIIRTNKKIKRRAHNTLLYMICEYVINLVLLMNSQTFTKNRTAQKYHTLRCGGHYSSINLPMDFGVLKLSTPCSYATHTNIYNHLPYEV